MKPAIKVLWLAIGVALVLGGVLAVAGFALGAHTVLYFTEEGIEFEEDLPTEDVHEATGQFQSVEISVDYGRLEFVVGRGSDDGLIAADGWGYEIVGRGPGTRPVEARYEDDTLTMNTKGWGFRGIDLSGAFRPTPGIRIFVPAEAELANIQIDNVSGTTILSDIRTDNLSLGSASGDIRLNDIEADHLRLNSLSGEVALADLQLNILDVDIASGDVSIQRTAAQTMTVHMLSGSLKSTETSTAVLNSDIASGSLDFAGDITEKASLQVLSGNLNLWLARPRAAYRFTVDQASGDVRIDDEPIDDPGVQGATLRTPISIDTASGDVDITFGTPEL
ncbi:MAG: DUF4097 domain-containing protein [Actinomycetes bacterium]|jgi:hypothetical protein|nr:DUF4097 domain-containing protein [Actinomycetes bacterium]